MISESFLIVMTWNLKMEAVYFTTLTLTEDLQCPKAARVMADEMQTM